MTNARLAGVVGAWIRMNFSQQTRYRTSFVLAVIGKVLRAALLVTFFQVLFMRVPAIGTWDRNSTLVLIAVFMTFESLISVTFHRNLAYYLPDHLRKGTFDLLLTQPLPPLFHVGFRVVDLMDAVSFVPVVGLWWFIIARGMLQPNMEMLLQFAVASAAAVVLMFSLSTIVAAISFWTIVQTGLGRFYEQLYRVGRYPIDALGTVQGIWLTYVVPLAVVGTVPAKALSGVLTWHSLGLSWCAVAVVAVIARAIWRQGLRRYESASS